MKCVLTSVFIFCAYFLFAQTIDNPFSELYSIANEHKTQAQNYLKNIDTTALTTNQKATYYWYKSLLLDDKEEVKKAVSHYNSQDIGYKEKVLLQTAHGLYFLTHYWQPKKAAKDITVAFENFKAQPELFNPFESLYIRTSYGYLLFSEGKYNAAFESINPYAEQILDWPCGYWSYGFLNNIILLNVVSNRPDLGEACGNKIDECNPSFESLKPNIFNNLGQLHIFNGNYYQALNFQNRAKQWYDYFQQPYDYEWYWHMGWLNSDLGNLNIAENYYRKAKEMIVSLDGENSYDSFLIQIELLKNSLRKNDTIQAKELIKKLSKIQSNTGVENDIVTDFIELKGTYYDRINDVKQAEQNYLKALAARKRLSGKQNFLILSTYEKWLQFLVDHKEMEKAKKYAKEVRAIIDTHFKNTTTHDLLKILLLEQEIFNYSTQENIEKWESILQRQSQNFEWKKEAYFQLANLYLNEFKHNTKQLSNLKKASEYIDSSFYYQKKVELFQPYIERENYQNIGSDKIRNLGIDIALQENKWFAPKEVMQKLFYYLDYAKYNQFRRHLLTLNTSFGKEKKELIQQEKTLRSRIQSYYFISEKNSTDQRINQKINEAKNQYQKVLQDLSVNAKDYYDYFVEMPKVEIEHYQKALKKDEVFISYTLFQDQLISLFISNQDIKINVGNFPTEKLVTAYSESMKNEDAIQYEKVAHELYEKMLSPFESEIQNASIIFSLDPNLSSLNLETFVKKTGARSFKDMDYLIYHSPVRYVVTATTDFLQKRNPSTQKNIAFIAPKFSANSSYLYQPFAQEWGNELKEQKNYSVISADSISKNEILNTFQNHDASIVATHTQINDYSPLESEIILGEKNDSLNLKLSEIMSIRPVSNLVVLASCNTGRGTQNSQLGLMSIANGFSFSGSNTVVATLWSVDEQSTISILKNCWNQFDKQNNLARHLQKAKQEFISQSHPKLANPFYWGGIIMYGKNYSQTDASNTIPYGQYIAIGFSILFLMGLGFKWFEQKG